MTNDEPEDREKIDATPPPVRKQRRGFAAMDPALQRSIASKGGRASHVKGTGHEWSTASAKLAGRKGGQVSQRNRRDRGAR